MLVDTIFSIFEVGIKSLLEVSGVMLIISGGLGLFCIVEIIHDIFRITR